MNDDDAAMLAYAPLEWTGLLGVEETCVSRGLREPECTHGRYVLAAAKDAYRVTFYPERNVVGVALYCGLSYDNAKSAADEHYVRIQRANAWLHYMHRFNPPTLFAHAPERQRASSS